MTGDGYQALALDLDGTLIDMDLRLDDRDVAAIGRVVEAGIRVIACTGRPFPGAIPWVRRLRLRDPLVCYQGAQVRALDGGMLLDLGVARELALEVVAFARQRDVHVQAYRDDRLLVEKDRPEAHRYANHAGMEIHLVADLDSVMAATTPKLVMVATPERIEELLPEARRRWRGRLFVTTSLPEFLELTDVDADKRRGLEFLAGRLGFTASQAVAVGDGRNDAPMLDWAGLGIAVEGAPVEVLEAADRTVARPGSGGIATLLGELFGA
ncbi:MAG: Cof-type HAD-IIB family hydrolase [Candidatus Dormibacteraceae bacterium]